jgi:putative photosynthetic complex assembly protein 2
MTTLWWALLGGLAGTAAIVVSRDMSSVAGAYLAFTGALGIWALHETSYLLGYVTGPRARACPDGVSEPARFWYGVKASLYHELAIIATVAALAWLTWESPNRTALYTFVILWIMRWSTKLNIFLGVRNLHEEYWPKHLAYLKSYTRERSMNALFPMSVGISAAGTAALLLAAGGTDAAPAQTTTAMLLAGILALAMIEHLFLMLRIPDDALWRAGTRSRRQAG